MNWFQSSNRKFWGIINLWFWNIKITPKILAKFASLNSSIARGALRSRRCLRARAILELSDENFAEVFGVIDDDGGHEAWTEYDTVKLLNTLSDTFSRFWTTPKPIVARGTGYDRSASTFPNPAKLLVSSCYLYEFYICFSGSPKRFYLCWPAGIQSHWERSGGRVARGRSVA